MNCKTKLFGVQHIVRVTGLFWMVLMVILVFYQFHPLVTIAQERSTPNQPVPSSNQDQVALSQPDREPTRFSTFNVFSAIVGLIGVVGSIYTYLSWRSGTKREKVYSYLFEVAEKGIDAKATEQQLLKGREEVKEVSQRIEELQKKIRKDIPKEARRAVLTDRLSSQTTHLMELFDSVRRTQSELRLLGDHVAIPPELRKEIEAEIRPEYLLREKRSSLKTYLTIVTTTAAISSAILPFPFSNWLSVILLLFAIPVIALLIKNSLPVDRVSRRRQVLLGSSIAFFLVSLTSLFFGAILLNVTMHDRFALTRPARQLLPLLFVAGFLSAMLGLFMLISRKRTASKRPPDGTQ